jgi:hypothetical protein
MGARVICKNCEREMAVMQEGMCGGCFGRAKGLEGSDKLIALAKAREDFKGRGPVGPGNRKPRVKAAGKSPRKAKVEAKPKTDPASGAIAPSCSADIGVKMEGTSSHPDISGADSTRKVDRKAVTLPSPLRVKTGLNKDVLAESEARATLGILSDDDLAFAAVPAVDDPAIISIMVNFTDGDHVLFEGLSALSKKYRRTPDQQLLWLLEHELTNERLLPAKRSEVAHGIDAEVA